MVYKPHIGNGFFMCDTIFLAYLLHIDMAPMCDTIFLVYMRHCRSSNMCDTYKRFQLCRGCLESTHTGKIFTIVSSIFSSVSPPLGVLFKAIYNS